MRDRRIPLRLVLLLLHIHRLLRGSSERLLTVVEVELVVPDSILHHGCSVTSSGEGLYEEQVRSTHRRRFVGHSTTSMLDPETIMAALQGVHMVLSELLGCQLGPFRALELLRHACCRWRLLRLLHLIIIDRLQFLYCDGLS